MEEASPKAPTAKPKKIRRVVYLERENLTILEEWGKKYYTGKMDHFINAAIEFMKSQDQDGLDASYQPVNRMHHREAYFDYFIERARKEGALPKELLPPQKPGRILRLVPPTITEEKGA